LAGHLVGLKLALLRNGLRRSSWPQQVALALGALAGLPLAFGGFLLLALVPRAEPQAGLVLVEIVFLALFCGWGLFPLLSFAGDASLDPSRLALLPLRPRELVAGLSLAACVGVAPLCTLVALGGAPGWCWWWRRCWCSSPSASSGRGPCSPPCPASCARAGPATW
jgi:ABC-2 type transport system permease protein